jgi:uncharacterized protein
MHEGASSLRRSRWPTVGLGLALVAALLPGATARAQSPDVVVSQVYGGGGNTGATYRNDFIELFNRGAAPVDVTGWSVQYASAGGSTWQKTDLTGTIPAGGYYLVREAAGSAGTADLPTPDVAGTIPMSATMGKVALATNQTLLTCGGTAGDCLSNPAIRDLVGYGTANNFEGAGPAPALTNTTAALRGGDGCTDSDDNSSDFASGAPSPRNSAAPLNPCPTDPPVRVDCGDALLTWAGRATSRTVTASDPNGTVTDIAITDIAPSPAPGAITLSNETPATAPGETATADVDASVPTGSYSVQVTASNDDVPSQSGACTLTVEVLPEPTPIYEIQGPTHESPLVGTEVATTGVVTVVVGNGFFLQDLDGDDDPATSDGIFAFGSDSARRVAPGDVVLVEGTVAEFRPASRPRDLTLTELSDISTAVIDEADLPAPAPITDRPDEEIAPDGIDGFERLEGMYVAVDDPTVVGPTNSFGEFVTVAAGDEGSLAAGGNAIVRDLPGDDVDYNPERIMIDDEARIAGSTARINSPQVQVKTGDEAGGDIVGALDYQFSNYRVQASRVLTDVLPAVTAVDGGADLRDPEAYEGRIATFNVENLFDCIDAPDKDDRTSCSPGTLEDLENQVFKLALAFEQELESPEIVIVEETENTAVLTGNEQGNIPGSDVRALLPRLEGTWDAVSFDASDVRGIEVAFVYNTDRVVLHDAFLSTEILDDTEGVFDGTSFRAGREPLVGFFTLDDIPVTIVGNHFKSKGGPQAGTPDAGDEPGDDPLYGSVQPPIRFTEQIRHKQADYVRDLVDLLLADNPDSNVVVGGDLNDFPFAEPQEGADTVSRVTQSTTDPLSNVVDLLPEETRYTFIFEGNSQVLDHVLLNGSMLDLLTGEDIAHFNTDYPEAFGDDPSLPLRTSDHDPLVSYFCTDATAPQISLSLTPTSLWPPNHTYRTVEATVSVTDDRDPDVSLGVPSVTSNEPDDAPGDADGNTRNDAVIVDNDTFRLRAERDENGTGRVYTITYRAVDACGNEALESETVSVPVNL